MLMTQLLSCKVVTHSLLFWKIFSIRSVFPLAWQLIFINRV
jgi:hypothetical protein